jgi:hypothetical protein
MTKILDAFENFFRAVVLPEHNNPEFFNRWLDNSRELETQLLVAPGKGYPVEGTRGVWTNGTEEWFNIRYPKNAMGEPYWRDRELNFDLGEHWLGVGSTWWDWVNRESVACGFDFDEVTSHAPGVGVTDEELEMVKDRACELDYVEVLKSTGGGGLHLYIWFDEHNRPKTNNHTEHAAIARAMLGKLSTDAAFDFGSHLDVCGGNLWVAHQKMFGTQGFECIKKATTLLSNDDIPPNWRDHLEVIGGKSTKVRVVGVTDSGEEVDEQDPLAELTTAHPKIPLDEVHKKILAALELTGASCVWVPDHNLVQTHTHALKKVYEQFSDSGTPMQGFFNRLSPGTDVGKPNCFMIPKREGAFLVFRFGKGTLEHDLWRQDRQGWTWCNYNRTPDLTEASVALGGAELEGNKGFHFGSMVNAVQVVKAMGSKLALPAGNDYEKRAAILRKNNDGRLVVEIDRWEGDTGFDAWNGQKKNKWIKVFNINVDTTDADEDYSRYDTIVRSCRSPSDADAGWRIRVSGGSWIKHPRENVTSVLSLVKPPDVQTNNILGTAIMNQWVMVCKPFHEEHPGGRQWNLGAPQFIYKPVPVEDDEKPHHPHWDKVMEHCGEDLDHVILNTSWCRNWGIFNGRDYLTAWVSCLLREPFEPLPYLFMYGPQNSGKSIFHEAISLLVTGGVVKADRALTNASDFNGELANAVLGVVDEVDIAKAGPTVYNKIKEWTTGQYISIHAKYQQVYQQRNCLHFVQTANYRDSCPIFPGDTRITAMFVGPLLEEIPKPRLIRALEEEAPHFMTTLLGMSLPTSETRLRLPVLDTAGKAQAAECNQNPLEQFITDSCYEVPGCKVAFKTFFETFRDSLSPIEQARWTKTKTRRGIPDQFPVGKSTGGQLYVGNLSFKAVEVDPQVPRYVANGAFIKIDEELADV